ncbi:hypothetical protein CUB89_02375 [Akkermansia muciniphila]|nr:hypothetical protein CUB89_02375 [Akkermansia muciniphila]
MEALREQSGTMFMENQQELKLKGSRENSLLMPETWHFSGIPAPRIPESPILSRMADKYKGPAAQLCLC